MTVRRSTVDQENLKPFKKSDKRFAFLEVAIISFSKNFTNHRKKTNRAEDFGHRSFLNIHE